MRDFIEALSDIGIEHVFGLEANRQEDSFDRVVTRAAWTKPIRIGFEARFPFRLESQFDERLPRPVMQGRDAERSLSIGFGNPNPPERSRFGIEAQGIDQAEAFGWFEGFNPIDTSGAAALVILSDPAHGQTLGSPGFEQESL